MEELCQFISAEFLENSFMKLTYMQTMFFRRKGYGHCSTFL
jgi:hypothetical protein